LAAAKGAQQSAAALIDHGADIDLKNGDGQVKKNRNLKCPVL
jgi:hypothetical protein